MSTHGERLIKEIGHDLRYWRLRARMTMKDMAKAAGVSVSSIERIENGGPDKYAPTTKIAEVLGIPLSTIIKRAEDVLRLEDDGQAGEQPERRDRIAE